MKYIERLVSLYIYSNIHIAIGTAASVAFINSLMGIKDMFYLLFVFASTLLIYGLHRIIGLDRVKPFHNAGRYSIIINLQKIIIGVSVVCLFITLWTYIHLPIGIRNLLVLPGALSILYVVPVFGGRKRLRDYNWIKIFLIAIVWAMVIGVIPYHFSTGKFDFISLLLLLEKAFFIFGITLPFDVRDAKIDLHNQVKTIPSRIGAARSYLLSYISIIVSVLMVVVLWYQGFYSSGNMLGLVLGYVLTLWLVKLSRYKTNDLYFSGVLDGTILMVALLGMLGFYF